MMTRNIKVKLNEMIKYPNIYRKVQSAANQLSKLPEPDRSKLAAELHAEITRGCLGIKPR